MKERLRNGTVINSNGNERITVIKYLAASSETARNSKTDLFTPLFDN